jgi:hypothetical protein
VYHNGPPPPKTNTYAQNLGLVVGGRRGSDADLLSK